MKKSTVLLSQLIFALLFVYSSAADITLPSVIGENMVLQRDMKVPVWGWADPGEDITVTIEEQRLTTKAGSDGEWMVKLGSMEAGGPFEITFEGKNIIKLSNVMVGDVWICSGQSNMEMMVHHCNDVVKEVAKAFYPKIRLFSIKNDLSPEPLKDCEASWEVCRPSTVGDFSATGYYFGREIMRELDVPVGLIHSSWGGTPVEVWLSGEAQKYSPEFRSLCDHWNPALKGKSFEVLNYYRKMGEWIEDLYYALHAKNFEPPYTEIFDLYNAPQIIPPESSIALGPFPSMPSWVNNAMIAPVVPYAIKGAIWYQGESNAERAYQYRELFPALIKDWRRIWGQGDFPFLFVQLANYLETDLQPLECAWAELREAQLMTLTIPNTAMAVTIDIGEADDIHPWNKQDVGKRLALGALKVAYKKGMVHSGPLYDSMTVKNGEIYLRFTEIGSGLFVKNGNSLKGFAIAGEDKIFVWADAKIVGDEILVWSNDVPDPVAVRYAWANNPVCNLYNNEGLPASPFRTDDWPGITADNK